MLVARAAFALALACSLAWCVHARVFTRCQLTRELININAFDKTFLSNWVCLIEQVSHRNTSAYEEKNSRLRFYGLYQIPSEWCKEGRKGGRCNIACELLLDDDIADDSQCASQIFEEEGFKYWRRWETRCKNNRLPDIEKCPDYMRSTSSSSRSSPPRARRNFHDDVIPADTRADVIPDADSNSDVIGIA